MLSLIPGSRVPCPEELESVSSLVRTRLFFGGYGSNS